MKTLSLIIRVLAAIAGGTAYAEVIPAKYLPLAMLVFLLASAMKDIGMLIGDYLDDQKLNKSYRPPIGLIMLFLVLPALIFLGCARFTTTQKDISYDDTGKPLRAITTKATACTLYESKSQLAQFQASQTDKTQSAKVGSLSQESAAGSAAATNAGAFLGSLIKAAK